MLTSSTLSTAQYYLHALKKRTNKMVWRSTNMASRPKSVKQYNSGKLLFLWWEKLICCSFFQGWNKCQKIREPALWGNHAMTTCTNTDIGRLIFLFLACCEYKPFADTAIQPIYGTRSRTALILQKSCPWLFWQTLWTT